MSKSLSAALEYRLDLIISIIFISFIIFSLAFSKPRSSRFGPKYFVAQPQARQEGTRSLQYSFGLYKNLGRMNSDCVKAALILLFDSLVTFGL